MTKETIKKTDRSYEIDCAFCKGTGTDQFGLLSNISICQVCVGKGKVEVEEPAIKCVFCKGSGVYPCNARITCTVCKGKGSVSVNEKMEECPKCKGKGSATESGLPCTKCGGKGVVPSEKNTLKKRGK